MARRVLFVVESTVPEAGSVAVVLPGLAAAIGTDGFETETISGARGDEGGTNSGRAGGGSDVDPASLSTAVRRADAVHIFGWGYDLARQAAQCARQSHVPYVVTPLGALSTGPYRRRSWSDRLREALGENRLLRGAAEITVLNEVEREGLRARGVSGDCPTLSLGVDVETYVGAPPAEVEPAEALSGRCLLLLGPIHPIEGVIPLLKAVGEVGTFSDGWHVVLAGSAPGRWRSMLEAAVRRKGADDRVRFVTASDVVTQRAWLDCAAILIAPALHARAPVSVLQAMAAGVPVMTTTCVTPPEAGDAIRVCEPTRAAIKSSLLSLLRATDAERRDLAQRARDVARARFAWSALAQEYASIYEKASARSSGRRGVEVVSSSAGNVNGSGGRDRG